MVVVTGVAGFIGFHVAMRLLDRGEPVVGIDNFDAYYDPGLKAARAAILERRRGFELHRLDIADPGPIAELFAREHPRRVVHLAAQAGVRASGVSAFAYERSNIRGHLSIVEACRGVETLQHLVYASSSSVYGERPLDVAFSERDPIESPRSIYAATKRANELMSQTFTNLYGLPQTGLRFFTAYGPWGRPDMAYFSFTRRILAGEPIQVFGNGQMVRDFTYVSDIVDGVVGVLDCPPPTGAHRLLNIGSGRPVTVLHMIERLEEALGMAASKELLPAQPGEVSVTFADISAIHALTGFAPRVTLEDGLRRFVSWYRDTYRVG